MSSASRAVPVARGKHAFWASLSLLYGALIFALSGTPGSALGALEIPPWLANLAHVPLYAGLAALVLLAFAGGYRAFPASLWPSFWTLGAVAAFALSDEYHQGFVPGRTPALGDLALDFAGAALAILFVNAISRRGMRRREAVQADTAGFIRTELLLALGAALLAFLLYLPSLGSDFIHLWDDDTYITNNKQVQSLAWPAVKTWWTEPFRGNYAPLTLASFALDHAVWGLDPFGYHLTNLFLHALASGLVAWLLLALRAPPLAAGIAALVYLAHPAQVEAVAWISERKALLATVFLLLSFIVYIRATRESVASRAGRLLSLILFVAALLSKMSTVILPGVLLLYDLGYRREPLWRIIREKIPFVGAAILFTLVNVQAQAELGIVGPHWMGGSLSLHLATVAGIFARYARLLLFPTGLSTLYVPPFADSLLSTWSVAGYLVLGAGALAAFRAFFGARRSLWWMALFWLGFLPVAQILPFWIRMADRYLQIPLIGYGAAAGLATVALLGRLRTPAQGAVAAMVLVGIFASYASLTLARQRVWQNALILWEDALARPPVHYRSHLNYANALHEWGAGREAIPYYERAFAANPDFIFTQVSFGIACAEVGDLGRARALLERAATSEGEDTQMRWRAALMLGLIYQALEQPEAALRRFQLAVSLDREDPRANVLLARSLRELGRPEEARARLAQAFALEPENSAAEITLAGLASDAGRAGEARARLDRVISAGGEDLADAFHERSRLEASQGNLDAARADLDRALREAAPGLKKRRLRAAREALKRSENPSWSPSVKSLRPTADKP